MTDTESLDVQREIGASRGEAVPFGDARRHETDFGRLEHGRPLAVVRARHEGDVAAALSVARRRRLTVRVRGAGHSCHGQSVCAGGILIANDHRAAEPPRLAERDGTVEVTGRAHWRLVESFLNRAGRSVAVLPDYLDLSVGGTLSVGGYGIDSVCHGAQVDHVERLRLVGPDGSAAWCSPRERPDHFGFALAGLGRVGVIERAVLRTVPHRAFTTLFVYRHQSVADLVESLAWMPENVAALPPLFKAVSARGRVTSCFGFTSASLAEARGVKPPALARGAPVRRWVVPGYRRLRAISVKGWIGLFGRSSRVWVDYVFDHAGLVAFEAFLRDLVARDAFAGCLKSVYLLGIRTLPRAVPLPLEAVTGLRSPLGFGMGLYSMVPAGRPDLLSRVRAAAAMCLERTVALGGRPYLYGSHDVDERIAAAIYGQDYNRFVALRRELDPGGALGALPL